MKCVSVLCDLSLDSVNWHIKEMFSVSSVLSYCHAIVTNVLEELLRKGNSGEGGIQPRDGGFIPRGGLCGSSGPRDLAMLNIVFPGDTQINYGQFLYVRMMDCK